MNISSWSLSDIMQLPDYLFGRRFMISTRIASGSPLPVFAISTEAFPDRCVLWAVDIELMTATYGNQSEVGLRFGDQLPANDGEFALLDRVLPGVGNVGDLYDFRTYSWEHYHFGSLRNILAPQGRRLVIRVDDVGAKVKETMVNCTVSSLPRDIPEWFLKQQG